MAVSDVGAAVRLGHHGAMDDHLQARLGAHERRILEAYGLRRYAVRRLWRGWRRRLGWA